MSVVLIPVEGDPSVVQVENPAEFREDKMIHHLTALTDCAAEHKFQLVEDVATVHVDALLFVLVHNGDREIMEKLGMNPRASAIAGTFISGPAMLAAWDTDYEHDDKPQTMRTIDAEYVKTLVAMRVQQLRNMSMRR